MAKQLLVLVAAASLAACGNQTQSVDGLNHAPQKYSEQHALSDLHTEQPAPKTKLQFAEDCTQYGSKGCASGTCVTFAAGFPSTRMCTKHCVNDKNCEQGWACRQIHPSAKGWVCVPPAAVLKTITRDQSDGGRK